MTVVRWCCNAQTGSYFVGRVVERLQNLRVYLVLWIQCGFSGIVCGLLVASRHLVESGCP